MTDFQLGIITLMKCAFTGEHAHLHKGFSLEEAEDFSAKQHITTLVYDGALKCGFSPKEPAMQRMFQRYVKLMLHSERQLTEVAAIFRAFDKNGIDYLTLKGCKMKMLYPKPELRYMGDADILIRVEQYDRIRNVMKDLGFTAGNESYHEYHWHKADVHIELHKSLIPSTNRSFYDYWGTGWDRAQKISDTQFALSDEDDFLFQFTHFAKHYRGPGIGCRYVLDLWLLLHANPELDHAYVEQELAKLHLLEFYQNIRTLLSVWFDGKDADERTSFMTDFIFSGSSWGNWNNGQYAAAVRNRKQHSQNKLGLIMSKLFPPFSAMAFQYPALKNHPVLLPVYWLQRLFSALFIDPAKRKRGLRIVQNISNDGIAQYKAHMQYVGLSFEMEQK